MGIGRFVKNEKGWALPLVLIVIVVITILGSTLWLISMTDLKQVSIEKNRMQAHYYARSGAELVATKVIFNGHGDPVFESEGGEVNITDLEIESINVSFNGNQLNDKITIKVYKENEVVVIESTGIDDGIEEKLKLKISKVGNERFEYWERVQ